MLDIQTYNDLHPRWNDEPRDFVILDSAGREDPPQDDLIYLFSLTVIAYNLRLKKWSEVPLLLEA